MPEDQGMLDTLGNTIRLARHVLPTTPALSPDGDSVLQPPWSADEIFRIRFLFSWNRDARDCSFQRGRRRNAGEADDPALRQAREFLKQHPLIDGHNDLPAVIRESGKPPRDVAPTT